MLFIIFTLYTYQIFRSSNFLVNKSNKIFLLHHFSDIKDLQYKFCKKGYINNITSFSFLSYLTNYNNNITPGLFLFKSAMNNFDILKLLKSESQIPIDINFNNIFTKSNLLKKIEKNLEFNFSKFESLLYNYFFINKYGFSLHNVKSMFITNTYSIYWTITPKELFNCINRGYYKFWNNKRLINSLKLKITPLEMLVFSTIKDNVKNSKCGILKLYIKRLEIKFFNNIIFINNLLIEKNIQI